MPGTLSYNRRRVDGGGAAAQLPCRYYATERRRHRYSSFSIMKWFRRSKHYGDSGDDDDDSAWFRDDLQRIRQAYVEQEPDYAAVTPVAVRRRPAAAATWSRWSGSTTTVYSFAYVDGPPRNDDEKGVATGRDDDDDDDKDAVEYIDAATLPAAHRRRTDRGQPNSSSTAAGTSARAGHQASTTGTMTATRRRNKRVAPPPPLATVQESHAVAAAVQGMSANTATVQRRVAGTMSRKKYRAPLPPANASELKPPSPQQQQQQRGPCRRAAPAQRRRKGPAPKPPVVQRPQPQPVVTAVAAAAATGSNVKRKISQYERDRLMQRVDKIEKHFFDKKPPTTSETTAAAGRGHGFASPAALYTAMAATNLTELDKRAAEICRQRNQRGGLGVPLTVPLTADHKNAIVAAVIRKSYPTATATAAAVAADDDGKRSDKVSGPSAADDEKRLVRHKRLAFFQQQRPTGLADKWSTVGKDTATASGATAVPEPSLQTKPTAFEATAAAKTSEVDATPSVVRSDGGGGGCSSAADTKNLPSEDKDINCYQQLMDMEMQSDLVLHNGSFECAVCLCTYDNNGVVLRDCLHVFCRLCLKMTIDHSKAEQVECPYIDERYSCTGVLQHREIKKILNSDEEYERFLQRSVERARQLLAKEHNGGSFQCSRPDCTGWCLIYDKNNVLEFKCPVCGTVTCVRCGSIHTQGRGCKKLIEENEGDGTLENLIERGDAMLCPGCNTVLSKQQGCDWIKCAVCFMEICWATKGPRWGPKGKGDTTAGCKCGIPPGRKCHIDCKYCH